MNNVQTKTINKTKVLTDLVYIHNDRIAAFQQTIHQSEVLGNDLRKIIDRIIYDGECYKQQLTDKINVLDYNLEKTTNAWGEIYKAWSDLKVKFNYSSQKSVIASCLYNEDIAEQAYNAALNHCKEINTDVLQLVEDQRNALKRTYEQIKKCNETRYTRNNHHIMYFN